MSITIVISKILPLFYLCFTLVSIYILFKLFSIKKDKKVLSIVIILLIFSLYLFATGVASILGILFNYTSIATYFSWLEEATICLLIIGVPYLIKENLTLNIRLKRVNKFIFLFSIIATIYIIIFSIIKPEIFIDIDSPFNKSFIQGDSPSRGKTGYLFNLRDIIISTLFIYGFIVTILNYKRSKLNEIQKTIFKGVLIIFILSIPTIIENISNSNIVTLFFLQFDTAIIVANIFMFSKIVSYIVKKGVLAENIRESLNNNQKKIIYNSRHMLDTKLLNRGVFIEDLNHKESTKCDSFIFIKIINYNQTYEFLGNDISKHILIQISFRLQNILIDNATLYHIETDEFVIKVKKNEDEEYIKRYTEIVRSILIQKFPIKGDFYFIDVKLGFVIPENNSVDDILNSAYCALNNADNEIKRIKFYNKHLKKENNEKLKIISLIQSAMKHREFYFEYQPIFSKNESVIGMEALLRWNNPYGIDKVINYAEKSGLMFELGMYTFNLLIKDLMHMRRNGLRQKIYFNISPIQLLNEDFIKLILEQIEKNNLSNNDIGFEITENILILENKQLKNNIDLLISYGFELILDDFGKGYSSLSYLYRLPFKKIKIDIDFLVDIPANTNKCSLLTHIVSMIKNLNYSIALEGIETEKQLDFIKELDLDYYQGYYFYKPVPINKLLENKKLF